MKIQAIRPAPVQCDPVVQSRFPSSFLEYIEHFLLHIHGNDATFIAHDSCHGQGRESEAATEVGNRHFSRI